MKSSSSVDITSIENELEKVTEQEKILDEELLALMMGEKSEAWVQVTQSINEMKLHAPNFDKMATTAHALADQTSDSNELAEKVSRLVRELDDMQMRVQRSLALVEDVLNLRQCADGVEAALERQDLAEATSHVRQYRAIDPAALVGHDRQLQRMRKAEALLKKYVLNGFKDAIQEANAESIPRHCSLLGQLGLGHEAVGGYLEFAARQLKSQIEAVAAHESEIPRRLSAAFNATAAFLQSHLPMVMDSLKEARGDIELVKCVHAVVEVHAEETLQNFKDQQSLEQKVQEMQIFKPESGNRPDQSWLTQLDELLDQTALVLQHTESYDRFVRHCSEQVQENHSKDDGEKVDVLSKHTALNAAASELSGLYSLLEAGLMGAGISKALTMDTAGSLSSKATTFQTGVTSSSVEDAFYVVQRCSTRAMATGHTGSTSAIINHVNNALSSDLLDAVLQKATSKLEQLELGGDLSSQLLGGLKKLSRTTQQDLSSAAQQAMQNLPFGKSPNPKGPTSVLDDEDEGGNQKMAANAREYAIHVNNLEAAERYCLKLKDSLLADVPTIFQAGTATTQILACISDLSQTSSQFSQARQYCLDQLGQRLRTAIRTAVADLLGEKSNVEFELDDAAYARNEATDPWAHKLLRWTDALLSPFSQGLCATNTNSFLQIFTEYLSKRIEVELMKKKFSHLGGLQLDKDLRCIVAYFVGKTGRGLRDKFSRLLQISTLLNVDRPKDALEYIDTDSRSLQWLLAGDDMKKVLLLRTDFEEDDINSLTLD